MRIWALKEYLHTVEYPQFVLPDSQPIPPHYHITEIGLVTKQYIDCGGKARNEQRIVLQIWIADDIDHRLLSYKLLDIVTQFQSNVSSIDGLIEIEYQWDTIWKYWIEIYKEDESKLMLIPTHTDCLAKESCGIPVATTGDGWACCGWWCC